ncbi:MAG TPA: hypothetical protein VHX38_07255 [Pseudonocardiaceae bacterium]|jgi:hypothetical protein|nr:hypothetical protein [Pseudonocardiaceae bacterium]
MSSVENLDHEAVLEAAWADGGNTAITLPSVDVNAVLLARYDLDREFAFTKRTLWDMEVRKAAEPDFYIPTVVEPHSAEKFPSVWHGRFEDFTRVSEQRLWLDKDTYGTVIEHVRLDHDNQRAFFIGALDLTTPDGRSITAGTGQPIFHVEHSVAGTEDAPLNLWRIVLLTDRPDPALVTAFGQAERDGYLRVFVEVYLRETVGRDLRRKPVPA